MSEKEEYRYLVSLENFDTAQDNANVDAIADASSYCVSDGMDGTTMGEAAGNAGVGEGGSGASAGTGQGCSAGMGM